MSTNEDLNSQVFDTNRISTLSQILMSTNEDLNSQFSDTNRIINTDGTVANNDDNKCIPCSPHGTESLHQNLIP